MNILYSDHRVSYHQQVLSQTRIIVESKILLAGGTPFRRHLALTHLISSQNYAAHTSESLIFLCVYFDIFESSKPELHLNNI
jgi:hypothetical protein